MRIEIENLTVDYRTGLFHHRRKRALEAVSLSAGEGMVLGLLGPNGAGKTTLFRSILGMVRPSAGTIRVGGVSSDTIAWKKFLGFLPEYPVRYDYLTALEFIIWGGLLCGIGRKEAEIRAQSLVERMGLARSARQFIRNLSKGTRQRVGLAQALINEPRLLLLDEPMSGLDPHGRRLVRGLLDDARTMGTTIVFSSHNLVDVEALADEVVLLAGGQVVARGGIDDITQEPKAGLEVVVAATDHTTRQRLALFDTDAVVAADCLTLKLLDDSLLPTVVSVAQSGAGRIVSIGPSRRSLEDWYIEQMAKAESSEELIFPVVS